jgi:CheY-like chemotaxis protein
MTDKPAEAILLVEDEPSIRGLMATVLQGAGYRVVQARNGSEALEKFDSTIDLLITDMRLPHMNGHEVIEQLRQRRHSLKVLSISAYDLGHTADPNIPFLAKPFTHEELLSLVRAILDGF